MSEMEDQLGAILGNPKMMEGIVALAQSMGQESPPTESKEPKKGPPPPPPGGDMDLAMVKALTGLARDSGIDKNQKALLNALQPYISKDKLQKLEKAMRAAKLAQQATGLLENGGLKLL